MFNVFETYIRKETTLSDEQLNRLREEAVPRKVRRRDFLLRDGDICRFKVFVATGLLRTYQVKEDGLESILRFSPENTWTLDPESYYSQTVSRFNIEALEDSEVLLFAPDSMHRLFMEIPAFRNFSDQLIRRTMFTNQERILMNIGSSAEEKYNAFVQSYPNVFGRVPLHMIASYLGVSRETLSRVRHTMARTAG